MKSHGHRPIRRPAGATLAAGNGRRTPELVVDDLRQATADGMCELSARVRSSQAEERRLWFSFPEEFAHSRLDGSAFLAAPLVWCMRHGENLRVDAPVSPRLLASVDEIIRVYRSFFPGEMASIEVRAPAGEPPPPTDITGSFFSGGVDSWYGVLTALEDDPQTPPLTHLVFSRDFYPRHAWSDDVVNDRAEATSRAAAPTGCRFVEVATNQKRDFGGPQLTAMALALGFRRMLIPSGVMRGELYPKVTHPVLDYRFSSERTEIVHYGDANRLDKTARVARSRHVLETLFVCRVKDDRFLETNCCRCEKCVRTMLELHVAGALENAPTFSLPLDPHAVTQLRIRPSRSHQWLETLHALGTGRQDRELATAMRLVIARSALHHAYHELDDVFGDPELANLAPTLPESIDRARELARIGWIGSEPGASPPPRPIPTGAQVVNRLRRSVGLQPKRTPTTTE